MYRISVNGKKYGVPLTKDIAVARFKRLKNVVIGVGLRWERGA